MVAPGFHLLFTDDVVLLTSSCCDVQCSVDWFTAECEGAGTKIGTSEFEAMVLSQKRLDCPLLVGPEVQPQVSWSVEVFKYIWVVFTREGRMERGISELSLL